jgi:hypothetical protein
MGSRRKPFSAMIAALEADKIAAEKSLQKQ